jgi:hypothetical protein
MTIISASTPAEPRDGMRPPDGCTDSSERMTRRTHGRGMVHALIARRGGSMRTGQGRLTNWQRLALLGLAVGGFAAVGMWSVAREGIEQPLEAACVSWDRDASSGVARLVPDPTPLAQARLDDALYRLRRARGNCRAGRFELARQDYASLRASHALPVHAAADLAPGHTVADLTKTGARP